MSKLRRAASPEDLEDAFEERAAILEFDAHFSRREAERRAREEQQNIINGGRP